MIDTQYSDYVDNRTLVQEEQAGTASNLLVGHATTITDPDLRASIMRMSFAEVIS